MRSSRARFNSCPPLEPTSPTNNKKNSFVHSCWSITAQKWPCDQLCVSCYTRDLKLCEQGIGAQYKISNLAHWWVLGSLSQLKMSEKSSVARWCWWNPSSGQKAMTWGFPSKQLQLYKEVERGGTAFEATSKNHQKYKVALAENLSTIEMVTWWFCCCTGASLWLLWPPGPIFGSRNCNLCEKDLGCE